MKIINTVKALKKIISESSEPIYVRWSRGPTKDKKQKCSRDYIADRFHNGLSSVKIEPEWVTDDLWLATRINEYWFLKMKDSKIGAWIYTGIRVGSDSDGYDSIVKIIAIARINNELINILQDIKNN